MMRACEGGREKGSDRERLLLFIASVWTHSLRVERERGRRESLTNHSVYE